MYIRGCIQKFPDWPPGARTVDGIALCHEMQLYRYFMRQSCEFCRHNPLKGTATSNTKGRRIFRYRLETFGYTLVTKAFRVKLSLYLTKQHAMKTYGGVEVQFHALTSALDARDPVHR